MSLFEATERLTAAIAAQDFSAIAEALKARAVAIAEFTASGPSPNSIAEARRALEAGDAARRQLHLIQQQTVSGSSRLTQIQQGFVETSRRTRPSRIEYRG